MVCNSHGLGVSNRVQGQILDILFRHKCPALTQTLYVPPTVVNLKSHITKRKKTGYYIMW